MLDDISKASGAESNAEAFAWLQVAVARVLEYAWHGHQWVLNTERQLEGRSNYLASHLMDRLTGRHSAIEEGTERAVEVLLVATFVDRARKWQYSRC